MEDKEIIEFICKHACEQFGDKHLEEYNFCMNEGVCMYHDDVFKELKQLITKAEEQARKEERGKIEDTIDNYSVKGNKELAKLVTEFDYRNKKLSVDANASFWMSEIFHRFLCELNNIIDNSWHTEVIEKSKLEPLIELYQALHMRLKAENKNKKYVVVIENMKNKLIKATHNK